MQYIQRSNPVVAVLQLVTMFVFHLRSSTGYHVWNTVHRTVRRSLHTRIAMSNNDIKKVVFLGTPDVAAVSLQLLHTAATSSSLFQIVTVVTQPPAPAGRNKKLTASPVQVTAETLGLPILTPENAKDPDFLTALETLAPDLCITAAYGNYLPKRFLAIPKYGTVNIHPSLLPKYRGAAPVQRCLEQGDAMSGVTVLFTVTKMDVGPIIAQHQVKLRGDEKADAFLLDMFQEGSRLLIFHMPGLLDGSISPSLPSSVQQQDEALATAADKLSVSDARVDLSVMTARQVTSSLKYEFQLYPLPIPKIHNKCRGLAIWPGLWTTIQILNDNGTDNSSDKDSANNTISEDKWLDVEIQRIKIITTMVLEDNAIAPPSPGHQIITVVKQGKIDVLRLVCSDGSILGITELQPPGKKIMAVRDFVNGLRGKWNMRWTVPPLPSQI